MNFSKARTIVYLLTTLALAFKLGFLLGWAIFFFWGFLMAIWEQPTHHWARSIFNTLGGKPTFWDNTVAWTKETKVLGHPIPWDDIFHISKTLSIALVCFIPVLTQGQHWVWYHCLAAGWLTTESFNLFYNYIFDTEH